MEKTYIAKRKVLGIIIFILMLMPRTAADPDFDFTKCSPISSKKREKQQFSQIFRDKKT